MTLLLDTHALIWLVHTPERLSEVAVDAIRETEEPVLASHVSLWELAVKRRLGKLEAIDRPALDWFEHYVTASGLWPLTIEAADLGALEALPLHHGDPFDRLLVAQAQRRRAALVTTDDRISRYDVTTVW